LPTWSFNLACKIIMCNCNKKAKTHVLGSIILVETKLQISIRLGNPLCHLLSFIYLFGLTYIYIDRVTNFNKLKYLSFPFIKKIKIKLVILVEIKP
jgi:hypothetical protein